MRERLLYNQRKGNTDQPIVAMTHPFDRLILGQSILDINTNQLVELIKFTHE